MSVRLGAACSLWTHSLIVSHAGHLNLFYSLPIFMYWPTNEARVVINPLRCVNIPRKSSAVGGETVTCQAAHRLELVKTRRLFRRLFIRPCLMEPGCQDEKNNKTKKRCMLLKDLCNCCTVSSVNRLFGKVCHNTGARRQFYISAAGSLACSQLLGSFHMFGQKVLMNFFVTAGCLRFVVRWF